MESTSHYFNKLPSNVISYLYQFFPPNEIIYYSQISHLFYKALSNDFIWESFAKTQDLFIPSEKESFPKWKDYYNYLTKLKTNLKSGRANLSFKMTPYRGHKSIITALLPIPMLNGPFSIILSGDIEGNIFTWNLDEDEDFEKEKICETKSEILDMKMYNTDKVVVWNREGMFYVYEVNVIHYNDKSKINSNGERFTLLSSFKIELGSPTVPVEVKQIYIDANFTTLYGCGDFYNKYKFKESHVIYGFDILKGTKKISFEINYDYETKNKIRALGIEEDLNIDLKSYKHSPSSLFAISGNSLYTFTNFDLCKFYMLSRFDNKMVLNNAFVFNTQYAKSNSYRINLFYIFDVFILKHNSNVCYFGIDCKQRPMLLEYAKDIDGLKLIRSLQIAAYFDSIEIMSYEENKLTFLINELRLSSINMVKLSPMKEITLEKSNSKMNYCVCDKYRCVVGYDNNMIKVLNAQTGTLWYNLLGGSMTIIPKSFIKHPNYVGFHLIKLTRWSIVGAMGNLIREYSFKPQIK